MSRVEQASELRDQGLRYRDIAKRIGVALSTVASYLSLAKADNPDESPRTAKARVQAEVAAGKRCRVCWLLLPCADHQP